MRTAPDAVIMKTALGWFVVGSALALAAFGCASKQEDLGDAAGATTITPGTGTSKITFRAPTGSVPAKVQLRRANETTPLTQLFDFATAVEIPDGDYCVRTVFDNPRVVSNEGCGYTFKGVMTVSLGGARFVRTLGQAVLGLDDAFDSSAPGSSGCPDTTLSTDANAALLFKKTDLLPHPKGDFSYGYAHRWVNCSATPFATFDFHVDEAQTTTVDLNDPTGHMTALILPPASRTTPGGWGAGAAEVMVRTPSAARAFLFSSIGDRPLLVRSKEQTELVFQQLFGDPHILADIATLPGDHVQPKLQLERLDIASPVVTLADGSTQTIAVATATINSFTSVRLPGGVDVPAGHYNVAIAYTHPASSTPVTETDDVTLP